MIGNRVWQTMKNYRVSAISVCRSLYTKRSALGAMRFALTLTLLQPDPWVTFGGNLALLFDTNRTLFLKKALHNEAEFEALYST